MNWVRVGVVLAAFFFGVWVTSNRYETRIARMEREAEEARLASVSRALEQARTLAREDEELLSAMVEEAESSARFFTEIKKEIQYVEVPADCTVSPDFFRLWNAANNAAAGPQTGAAAPGVMPATVSQHASSGGVVAVLPGSDERGPAEPRRGDGESSGLRPQASLPRGLR